MSRLALAGAVLLLIAGCGGGNDSRTAGIDRGGVRSPVAVSGPITGFGSIIVNGVRFDIASAQIDVNGATATQADLEIGQIVVVIGDTDIDGSDAVAQTVVYDANVRGVIEAIDGSAQTIRVLGQTVLAESADFELRSRAPLFASLRVGDGVEVSGFVGAGGAIVASLIEFAPADELRVRGRVSDVDTATHRFSINELVVDYSAASLVEDFASGEPANGDTALVVGESLGTSGELLADRISLYGPFAGAAGREAEVEDLITRFVSSDDFDVGGLRIRISGRTRYEDGSAGDLALNVKVQVEGRLAADGSIAAEKIEIKDGGRAYDE